MFSLFHDDDDDDYKQRLLSHIQLIHILLLFSSQHENRFYRSFTLITSGSHTHKHTPENCVNILQN